ncbi:uncharacterized protein LOC124631752 [Helicoverpa zea]|uniref:uncharacterized protein LOC124631752 n=1 Tax=Helicoverpa zea TaxID=7113 RepID=UPI001F58255D|nr:uncharacterized protein LOC124631752 [Helicoverpa zea]
MSVDKISVVTVVIFILVHISDGVVNPFGPTVVNDYTNCISKVIDNEFDEPGLLIFANTNDVSTSVTRIRTKLLKRLHKEIKFSIEVMSPNNEVEICDLDNYNLGVLHVDVYVAIPFANYFVIIIDSYTDFSFLASKLIRSRSWNPFAKFIILLFNFVQDDKVNIDYVERVLSCLFKYNAINVIIAVPKANNFRNAIIYSWRPYDPPKYCGYFNETAKDRLVVQNMCESGVLKHDRKVFDNKIPHNMEGCVIEVLALQRHPFISDDEYDANIEKLMIDAMLKRFKMKARYNFIDGYRGERENVGEWNGGLKKLASKSGHLLLGGIFPDFDVHEDFETSVTYLADAYTWVVPRAHKSAAWVALVIIFKSLVWYSVIAGFFLCGITWKIIAELSGDSDYNRSFRHCFLNTWITVLGFVSYLHPVKESLRVFFVFLNIYCMLFSTAYQTKLFEVLTNPSHEYQIQTVEELVESGLKFGGFEELHDLFYNSTDPFDYRIGDQWTDITNITEAMIDVAVHRNFSLLCSRLELAHISGITPELSDSVGNYKYYTFTDNVFSVPIETIALRGFPFMMEFSATITIFKQSGLNEGLRQHFAHFNERRRARQLRALLKEKSDVNPLSSEHLQGGFLALALGYFSGTLALIVEVIVNCNYVQNKFANFKRRVNRLS